jgi:hypothetical protein
LSRSEITAGIEGRFDRSRYENWQDEERVRIEALERDTNEQLSGALFVQSMTPVASRLMVSLGARFDALRTRRTPVDSESVAASHGVVSPKLGVSMKVTPAVSVYGNASRGFRSPDNINVFPTLGPITAWSYEAGLKADEQRYSGSLAAFQMDVSDEQQFSEICGCANTQGIMRGVPRPPVGPRRRVDAIDGLDAERCEVQELRDRRRRRAQGRGARLQHGAIRGRRGPGLCAGGR